MRDGRAEISDQRMSATPLPVRPALEQIDADQRHAASLLAPDGGRPDLTTGMKPGFHHIRMC